ncbi:MAG: hypothetical protein ABJE95_16820 [Byssovorax sp.]
MFVMTGHQREAFRARGFADLREALLAHVIECFPARAAEFEAVALARHVEDGMRRAEGHGLRLERDICAYVELMIVFGSGFETDPRCPWATALRPGEEHDPSARIQATFAGALAALDAAP